MDIRVIIFQEGDQWSAHCVDYDIGTNAPSLKEVKMRMTDQIIVEAMASLESNGEIFSGIPKAPADFEEKWQSCEESPFASVEQVSAYSHSVNINSQLCA